MSARMPHVDTLLLCASMMTIGMYACAIWERSLRSRQQQMYIDAVIRVVDVMWNGAPHALRGRMPKAARADVDTRRDAH